MAEQKTGLFYQEMEIIEKRIMLNKLIFLNIKLHNALITYAKSNGIPLSFDTNIIQLIEEIKKTDIEIFPQPFKIADESLHEGQNSHRLDSTIKKAL